MDYNNIQLLREDLTEEFHALAKSHTTAIEQLLDDFNEDQMLFQLEVEAYEQERLHRMPSSRHHAKHISRDVRTNLRVGRNNTHHQSPTGGNRPCKHKPHTRTTSREDNPARAWTNMHNSTGGLGYTKHGREPYFSNSTLATDNRIHEHARNRGITLRSTRANTSTRGHSRNFGRRLRNCSTNFVSPHFCKFWF